MDDYPSLNSNVLAWLWLSLQQHRGSESVVSALSRIRIKLHLRVLWQDENCLPPPFLPSFLHLYNLSV